MVLLVAALALVLSACYPVITVETRDPAIRPSIRVEPVTSGVVQTIRIPSPRPNGALEVVARDGSTFKIPPGHFPDPGSCRIWYPGRPPGQQPAQGACDVLDKRVPAEAYLVYG